MSDKFVSPTARAAIEVFARAGVSPSDAYRILKLAGEQVSLSSCYRIAATSSATPGSPDSMWYPHSEAERPGA